MTLQTDDILLFLAGSRNECCCVSAIRCSLCRWSCLRTTSASSPCPCGHLSGTCVCEEGSGAIATVESTHISETCVLTSFSKKGGITTQKTFLTNLGINQRAEIISKDLPFSKKADIYYRLNRLIDKNQMGDLFKVMLLTSHKINLSLIHI